MRLTALRPILWTDRINETIEFYTQILSFTIGEQNDEWGWASLFKDDIALMLAKPNGHTTFSGPVFTGSFYFTTDDVDQLWEELKERATVCYSVENFDWGMREFAIYDNNGYLLQFGQKIQSTE